MIPPLDAPTPGDAGAPTSQALLAAVASGDRGAFRVLHDRYAPRLLAYVRRMGGPGLPAEDVVQDVLISVWIKAGQYRPERGAPEAWIFTIARRKVLDLWRTLNPVVDLGALPVESVAEPCLPEDSVTRLSLAGALAALDPEHRRPVELAFYGGYTYAQTARALGLPEGTLKSRIRVALGKLRGRLAAA